jgi:hypothetical protein
MTKTITGIKISKTATKSNTHLSDKVVKTELVKANRPDHDKAIKAIEKFRAVWTKELAPVVKECLKDDKTVLVDSYTFSVKIGEYIELAEAFNASRAIGSEETELKTDYSALCAVCKEIAKEDKSAALNRRIYRGVKHRLFPIVCPDKFSWDAEDNLKTAHKILSPRVPTYDTEAKQNGTEENTSDILMTVTLDKVLGLWAKHAPKADKGPDQNKSSDATDQMLVNTLERYHDKVSGRTSGNGPAPLSSFNKDELHALDASLRSGYTTEEVRAAVLAINNQDPAAVAA